MLQQLIPVQNIVTVKSGLASRGESVRNDSGLSGFRWDIPAPDPSLGTVVWATLSFDWAFYSWLSWEPQNDGDSSIRVSGSIDWIWYLVGNSDFLTQSLVFLRDFGDYSFYMDLAPGDAGFSVGWLTPPFAGTFTDDPRDKRFGTLTPLQALLATNVDGALRLWFRISITMSFLNTHTRSAADPKLCTTHTHIPLPSSRVSSFGVERRHILQ